MFRTFTIICAIVCKPTAPAVAAEIPGVTATEINLGGIFPFSGPASSLGLVSRSVLAIRLGSGDAYARGSRRIDRRRCRNDDEGSDLYGVETG